MKKNLSNKFSTNSTDTLNSCCLELVTIATAVLPFKDVSVTCGARNSHTQYQLYKRGKSELQYPDSKHNIGDEAGRDFSDAVDLVIWHPKYGSLYGKDKQLCQIADDFGVSLIRARYWFYMQYAELNALMQFIAQAKDIELRWGGDWNSVNGILDQSFDDFYHWEVIRHCPLNNNTPQE